LCCAVARGCPNEVRPVRLAVQNAAAFLVEEREQAGTLITCFDALALSGLTLELSRAAKRHRLERIVRPLLLKMRHGLGRVYCVVALEERARR